MERITHDGWFELHTGNHGFISLEPRPLTALPTLGLAITCRAKAVLGAYVTMRIAKDR